LAANAYLLKPAAATGRNGASGPFALAAKSLAGSDLCSVADLSAGELTALLKLAHAVKARPQDYRRALDAKQLVMFFEKASLRTRLSFEAAINTLGGNGIFVDQTQSPLGERESLADISRNVERWSDAIVLRTYSHDTITEMAQFASVPVINALSDLEHPCQAIADFMTLEERFGTVRGMKFVYVGDGNAILSEVGGSLTLMQDAAAAVTGADAIYTDVCTSMGFEHEATKRAPLFKPYQVNEALMARAAQHAVFLHCLPAHRNAEVTDQVLDGPQSIVFDQAENRMHAQKAILLMLLGASVTPERGKQDRRKQPKSARRRGLALK
jgi:ornithine carbamoyltransferase